MKSTVEEVAAYIREKGYTFSAEAFWNYYESNGWRVGRSPMRSWRSACVTWQKKRERDARTEDARIAHIDAKMDDLGAKPPVCSYGVRRELAGEFITRYHLLGRGRLFITTNLDGEAMLNQYTMRITSRLKDLCVPLHLAGRDKRRWTNEKLKSSEVERLKSSGPLNLSTIQPFNRNGGAA